MMTSYEIRETTEVDRPTLFAIHHAAFAQETEARLTLDLLDDPSAAPRLSLLALGEVDVETAPVAVGHILFTGLHVLETQQPLRGVVVAPLGVVPAAQRRGVGGRPHSGGDRASAGERR